ncbi:MAG: HEAT repeat domain-containing protein, partial [Candidatus Kryptonium sp.]
KPAIGALVSALRDESSNVQRFALEALRRISSDWFRSNEVRSRVSDLIVALKSRDSSVRIEIVKILSEIGDARAVDALVSALRDENSDVRKFALEALKKIGEPAVNMLISALGSTYNLEFLVEVLVKMGKPAIETLIIALKDKDWRVRESVVEILGNIGDPETIEALIFALKDRSRNVQKSAAEALGKIGDVRAIKALIPALKSESENVRESVVRALVKIGKSAVEALITAIEDKSAGSHIRYYIARALGEIGSARAIAPLISILRDKDVWVQRSALEALRKISSNWFRSEEAKSRVSDLIVALSSRDRDVRVEVVKVLGEMGDARVVGALISALRDEYWKVR